MFKVFMTCFRNRSPGVTCYVERHIGTNPPCRTHTHIIRNDYYEQGTVAYACKCHAEKAWAGEVGICGHPELYGDTDIWKYSESLSVKSK